MCLVGPSQDLNNVHVTIWIPNTKGPVLKIKTKISEITTNWTLCILIMSYNFIKNNSLKIGMNSANKLYQLSNLISFEQLNRTFYQYKILAKIQFLKYGKTWVTYINSYLVILFCVFVPEYQALLFDLILVCRVLRKYAAGKAQDKWECPKLEGHFVYWVGSSGINFQHYHQILSRVESVQSLFYQDGE